MAFRWVNRFKESRASSSAGGGNPGYPSPEWYWTISSRSKRVCGAAATARAKVALNTPLWEIE
jgi:hypothetical protein